MNNYPPLSLEEYLAKTKKVKEALVIVRDLEYNYTDITTPTAYQEIERTIKRADKEIAELEEEIKEIKDRKND